MNKKDRKYWAEHKYPCTIIRDRYCGAYSGGFWTAWPLDERDLPQGPSGSDCVCAGFWGGYSEPVGKGKTAQEAFDDLVNKIKK